MTVDLLITDIQMPQMDGELLLKAVREIDSTLPVLVMTGIGNKELVVRLMKLGCSDYIDKPFSLEELEAHVDPLLEKARRISEKIRHVDDSTDGSTRKMESMRGLK
jgi:phosphoserine phosphatase RsbU/P